VSGQLHAPASLPQGNEPAERLWIGGQVGPRTVLDYVEKEKISPLPGLELRPLGRPARSQSLYRLRYPSSSLGNQIKKYEVGANIPRWKEVGKFVLNCSRKTEDMEPLGDPAVDDRKGLIFE
jgi:hypothetical protein